MTGQSRILLFGAFFLAIGDEDRAADAIEMPDRAEIVFFGG